MLKFSKSPVWKLVICIVAPVIVVSEPGVTDMPLSTGTAEPPTMYVDEPPDAVTVGGAIETLNELVVAVLRPEPEACNV